MLKEVNFNTKRIFLVDKESVADLTFIKKLNVNSSDDITIFLSQTSTPISNEDIHMIFSRKLKVKSEFLQTGEKNVLNMKLICMLMDPSDKGPRDFYVVSNENDISSSLNYVHRTLGIQVRLISDNNLNNNISSNKEIACDYELDA